MLTASEKRWLIKKAKKWANFCDVCIVGNENCKLMHFRKKCPTNIQAKDLLDALEFESRVAATLANIYAKVDFDYGCYDCPVWRPCSELGYENCKFMILKYARITVEEEMKKCIK